MNIYTDYPIQITLLFMEKSQKKISSENQSDFSDILKVFSHQGFQMHQESIKINEIYLFFLFSTCLGEKSEAL